MSWHENTPTQGGVLVLETTLKALCCANMCMYSLWFVHGHEIHGTA